MTTCGRICYKNRKVNLSQVFAGQGVGVRQVDERIWLVSFTLIEMNLGRRSVVAKGPHGLRLRCPSRSV